MFEARPGAHERLAIVGSGSIACGLAAVAARHGEVSLWARTDDSALRARDTLTRLCGRLSGEVNSANVKVHTGADALQGATFVVEAIIEEATTKATMLERLGRETDERAVLATTTSSLSIERLAEASGRPHLFVGLHVFNPVTKMKLVELAFPAAASDDTRQRAHDLCRTLGKVAVDVPDTPGFVVNRLLFPYLFDAVRLLEQTGMLPADVDSCMELGAGHPMGPLALLDLVGLDVACAIASEIDIEVPPLVERLIAEGALGRKSGRGFHDYP
jgi:3-hydroxybutyryl-CoA dehydrogenase